MKLDLKLLTEINKDGMSKLYGGALAPKHINNGTHCNEINNGTNCDVINHGNNCSLINNSGACSEVNNWGNCN